MPTLTAYTVTISGSEREDGEAPYTYVVNVECSADDPIWKPAALAVSEAMHIHATNNELETTEELASMEIEEVYEGTPPPDCDYHWNDER
ncbi:hypothetical protein [Streptosporangium subroseum]|uniref:hypothetical protein n=1 Tax=Streptosporangium subroseum TaxID=106412 RepID=UPI0030862413|nr:hypothetical protein OHB15_14035 [Streptosporangium subroseum]